MKKIIAAVALCCVCVNSWSDTAPMVSTSATGSIEAMPDIAVVSGRVMVKGDSPADAVKEVRAKLDSLIHYMLSEQIETADFQAAQIVVNPSWHYPRDKPRELVGYQASADFHAKVRDISKLSELYGGMIQAGATDLMPTTFDFSNRQELELEAISKAVIMAKRKAEAGLQAVGQEVGDVVKMEVDTRWQQPPVFKGQMSIMRAEMADSAAPEVNVGHQTIESTVSIAFEID